MPERVAMDSYGEKDWPAATPDRPRQNPGGAIRECCSALLRETTPRTRAGAAVGAGVVAGRLMVARAELFHQNRAATTTTTTAIVAAARRSPLVRRSGLTI